MKVATPETVSNGRNYWLAAVAAALVAAAIQAYRLGDSIRGFHLFNEGFYLANAVADASRGLLAPVLHPIDPNNPFVYPFVLASVVRLFGPSVSAARTVSVVATGATVLLTFGLAKRLYNERIAIMGAVFIALMPGMLLVGRNIQIDALMLALEVAVVWAFVVAVATDSLKSSIVCGGAARDRSPHQTARGAARASTPALASVGHAGIRLPP